MTLDFADFYREAKDECLRTVVISTGDQEQAQDLVAEAFARACASWRQVSRHPNPKAWVVRTALNVRIDRWRIRRRELPLTPPMDTVMRDQDPADPAVIAAVRRLPERQRQVVALRLLLDLDTETTAETLGISPGTVKAHLSRAVAALREALDLKEQIS
ncbi:MAG TPA: sigma-70 family RNA polymerase sigma factor [Trebonia sp.]|nr:sigma-70 family RNA polymerase sigma factor [Trebonia sp.]